MSRKLLHGIAAVVFFSLLATSFRNESSLFTDYESYVRSPSRMTAEVPSLQKRNRPKTDYSKYVPSKIEDYILSHMDDLKLNLKAPELVKTCHLWTEPDSTPYHSDMTDMIQDLEEYYRRVDALSLNVTDIRLHLDDPNQDICAQLELDVKGLPALFPNEKLSYTRAGWVEPLLPPMRHPNWCIDGTQNSLASIEYLIHDFAHMCSQMKRTSRTVLLDMGASLTFSTKWPSPVLRLVEIFEKFGLPFDHIYAWELTKQDPKMVFEMLPESFNANYHWINVGVDADPNGRQNPFKLLLDHYNEDDLVIVKMDIDGDPTIEHRLAQQLLNDERLLKIVDHFYFEHHVNQLELRPYWGAMTETVEESMTLFHELRKRGVAAHFWT